MTTQEIIEGNKLIAEFMGYAKRHINWMGADQYKINRWVSKSDLKFHSSWDWLMPVVDQIKCLNVDEYTLIDNIDDVLICIELEKTFEAVIDFIKWHNQNK